MFNSFRKQWIPWALATGRGVLGFVLIAGQRCNWNTFALAGIIVLALLSDIYDGVLARRWGCDTAGVRLFDSMADTLFYLCVGIALWIGQPQIWRTWGGLLAGLLAAEGGALRLRLLEVRQARQLPLVPGEVARTGAGRGRDGDLCHGPAERPYPDRALHGDCQQPRKPRDVDPPAGLDARCEDAARGVGDP